MHGAAWCDRPARSLAARGCRTPQRARQADRRARARGGRIRQRLHRHHQPLLVRDGGQGCGVRRGDAGLAFPRRPRSRSKSRARRAASRSSPSRAPIGRRSSRRRRGAKRRAGGVSAAKSTSWCAWPIRSAPPSARRPSARRPRARRRISSSIWTPKMIGEISGAIAESGRTRPQSRPRPLAVATLEKTAPAEPAFMGRATRVIGTPR